MSDDCELIKKRLCELAKKSYNSGIFVFTDFLGLPEQSAFGAIKNEIRGISYTAFGGAQGTERIMLRFGDPDEIGYEIPFPITTLLIEPKDKKFAEKLTHRDFLGAILNLGIERKCLGDIVVRDSCAYLFLKEDIAEYVTDSLTRVRHTDVKLSTVESVPEGELYRTEQKRIQLSGERLDATIAKVFGISREDSSRLFAKSLVYVGGRVTENTSYAPKVGDIISVRGYGRMIYRGYESLSRKGKINIIVELYV